MYTQHNQTQFEDDKYVSKNIKISLHIRSVILPSNIISSLQGW